ncbi:MAG: hypothetical protein FJ087_04545 [Deltaproteobacteria bacterium]|nr:hypothetical protein [Deltaproteobacteria bacterium]
MQDLAERALRTHLRSIGRDDVQNGAVVVADTQTGEVLALVGSRDFLDPAAGQVDGARSPRQPGSTLKPFLYAMALSRGRTPASLLSDVPTSFTQAGGQAWSPRDHDRRWRGPVRLREALASSLNVPAARLLDEVGVAAFLDVLHALGFDDLDAGPDEYGLGLVLGDAPVRLASLADAYATLGRGGVRRPFTLLRDGPQPAETRVFPADVAWMVSDILSDDDARGLTFGRHGVLDLPFRVAAKTGTSADHRDSWCVGYTPERTVGVWVGNMAGGSMEDVWGAQGAAPVFREVMLGLAAARRPAWPPEPPGIVRREVCPLSGGAPGPACPGTVREAFPASAAPPPPCDLHRAEAGGTGDHGPSYHAAGAPLRIARPVDGEEYRLDPDVPPGARSIVLLAAGDPANGPARFRIDGAPGPVCEVNVPCPWPARPGDHDVALEGVRGRVRITVR